VPKHVPAPAAAAFAVHSRRPTETGERTNRLRRRKRFTPRFAGTEVRNRMAEYAVSRLGKGRPERSRGRSRESLPSLRSVTGERPAALRASRPDTFMVLSFQASRQHDSDCKADQFDLWSVNFVIWG
jgi:hypothetical protein